MFNNILIALLLVATIDIIWAESEPSRDLWLKRHRRAIDEQSKWVNFGSLNRQYQNNYYFDQNSENGDDTLAVHRSLGTSISQQRRQVVEEKIERLRQILAAIHNGVKQIESRNHRGLDQIFHETTEEESNMSLKLNTLYRKCGSLEARLDYQELRLRHFNDESLPCKTFSTEI
nr:BV-like protein [Cotesia vestalis bracovirus]